MNIEFSHSKEFKYLIMLAILVCLCLIVTRAFADSKQSLHGSGGVKTTGGRVPLLEGLYTLNFPVSTNNEKAQAYFNQGLVLTYGFDHADAEVSFLEAARHDPNLAMAYWGVAFVLGPNINASMNAENVDRAYAMARKALVLAGNASPKERDLIAALSKRYGPERLKDRTPLDRAFAEAMQSVYETYPNDPDVAVLYAEALMDLHPWDYWSADDMPQPWTPAIQDILERAVREHPNHPHTHHLYIHLMENSPTPEATVKSADIILNLVPASGHLVHMAGHAYYAAGFYNDCSRSNERALEVDRMLLSSFDTQGLYQLGYMPHVRHYLLASYMMEGRSKEAFEVARTLSEGINPQMMRKPGLGSLQHYYLTPYYTLVRFGKWGEILEEPLPAGDLIYPLGMLHYARGMARVRKGETEEARQELKELNAIIEDPALESVMIWEINRGKDLLVIAAEVLAGEIAAAIGEMETALKHLERGVQKEMALLFDEPPPWYFPVRQALGRVLLDAGLAKRAEEVYWKDLQKNAENPWALYGLGLALRRQGKSIEASDVEKRFRKAWARADIELSGSVF
jgi:tetratricopeptide (TPR) repeat protein